MATAAKVGRGFGTTLGLLLGDDGDDGDDDGDGGDGVVMMVMMMVYISVAMMFVCVFV